MKTDSFCAVHVGGQITVKWKPLFLISGRLPKVYASCERVRGRHMGLVGRTFSIKGRIKQCEAGSQAGRQSGSQAGHFSASLLY
jgi:hypothetical protein